MSVLVFEVHIERDIAHDLGGRPSIQAAADDDQDVEIGVGSGVGASFGTEQAEIDDVVAKGGADAVGEVGGAGLSGADSCVSVTESL